MKNILYIFFGAGVGGVLRYWVATYTYLIFGKQFPIGTLVVNVSGCILMGVLYTISLDRFGSGGTDFRAFILIGFLGGYTTFSTFSIETITLFENGNILSAFMNILLSITFCLLGTYLGILGVRNL